MTRTVLTLLTLFSVEVLAQENLVPNPSFEDTLMCPSMNGHIEACSNWYDIHGTNEYFHECSMEWGVPDNHVGNQPANDGQAYAGFSLWVLPFNNSREFIGVSLLNPLDSGQQYIVGFHVNLADPMGYGISNIGAYLSMEPPLADITGLLSLTPQISLPFGQHATSMESWTHIEGTMIANGGEQFLTIGNFDDDSLIDTISVKGQSGVDQAFYYLDNVYVVKDTTYHIGVAEYDLIDVSVYPNPATDLVTVQVESREAHLYEIGDLSGRIVARGNLNHGKTRLDVSGLTDGLYTIRVLTEERTLAFRKLVVQR